MWLGRPIDATDVERERLGVANDVVPNNPVMPSFRADGASLGVRVVLPEIGGVLVAAVFEDEAFNDDVAEAALLGREDPPPGGQFDLAFGRIALAKVNEHQLMLRVVQPGAGFSSLRKGTSRKGLPSTKTCPQV